MRTRPKLLVLGCGSIGARHFRNATLLSEAAVFDPYMSSAEQLAYELKAKCFSDLSEAIAWGPDGVVIATPNDQHILAARSFLEIGIPVLIEKPISHSLDCARQLVNEFAGSSASIYVVCNMRYHPAILALRDHLASVGRVFYARAYFGNYLPNMRPGRDYRELYCAQARKGGGVLLDAVHEFDYLQMLFGRVSRASASIARVGDLDIDVEDFANVTLEHESGSRSVLNLDYLRPWKRRGCEIVGSKGFLTWESEGKDPEVCTVRFFDEVSKHWTTILNSSNLDGNQPYVDLLKEFLAALAGRDNSLQTGEQAVRSLATIMAAKNAATVAPQEVN